jgi:RNA polymerase sigma-70 factor (ECF subfamily)
MISNDPTGESAGRAAAQFATTHWSVVLAAAGTASPEAQAALEALCRTYWYPLYAFVRMRGHSPEDAKDLTQAFFERFLQRNLVRNFDPAKGRFRNFLLSIVKRFLCDQHDQACAARRGGGLALVPFDTACAEVQISSATAARQSPETAFERAWADTVLRSALQRLRTEYDTAAKGKLFQELNGLLARPADRAAYSEIGTRLDMSADAVAMAVARLRKRYRELVRAEVAGTVATPAEIDDEMRYLVDLLTR